MTTYLVTAPTAIAGHQPGETFVADLEPKLEGRLLARGQLQLVTTKAAGRPVRPAGATAPRKRRRQRTSTRSKPTSNGGGK